MGAPLQTFYTRVAEGLLPDVRDSLSRRRELFAQRPKTMARDLETLSGLLHELRYLPYRPEPFAVETTTAAMAIDDQHLV